MTIYMKYADLEGDVTAPGHEGWANVLSMNWGMSRGISTPTGTSQERESSATSISDVTVVMDLDKLSTNLMKEAAAGQGKEVIVHLMQTGQDSPEVYMEFKLTNTLVTSWSTDAAGDVGKPTVVVGLNFTKIDYNYSEFDNTNAKSGQYPGSYDVTTGKAA